MLKIHIPTYHAKSVYDIDISFFKEKGYKYIFIDLDNTLDSYRALLPSERAIKLVESLKENDIELIILSNNTGERVGNYATTLGVKYFSSVLKPFKRGVLKVIKEMGIKKNEIVMIGDQTVTDIAAANSSGLDSILTDKIVPEDQFVTRTFNRIVDNIIRKGLKKKDLLKEVSYGGH